jgi:hypothetical protein
MLDGDLEEGLWEINDLDEINLLEEALAAWDKLCVLYGVTDFWTEQTFELNPETGGTADVIAAAGDRTLVVDWKFGQGVAVAAEGNVQGLFYAMVSEGKVNGYDPATELTVAIIQPMPSRADTVTLKTWDVPRGVYEAFKRDYVAAQKATGLHAGEHCRWCPASATCPERSGEAMKALTMDPARITTLAASLDLADEVIQWAKAVKDVAHAQIELGNAIPGWKLVAKRGVRKWRDSAEAEALVRELFVKPRRLKVADITETTFMTAPKLEKVFRSKGVDFDPLSAHINKSSTGTTLARESDPREQIVSAGALKSALGRLT